MIGFLWENEKAEACIPVAGGGKWDMAPKDTGVERRGPGRGKEGFQRTLGEALTSTPSILVQPLHFSLSHIMNFDQMNISQSKTMRPSISCIFCSKWASQVMQVLKNLPANTRDIENAGSILGFGRSPGGGNSNPLQYSCLENPMERGAWWAIGLQSWTRLSN